MKKIWIYLTSNLGYVNNNSVYVTIIENNYCNDSIGLSLVTPWNNVIKNEYWRLREELVINPFR